MIGGVQSDQVMCQYANPEDGMNLMVWKSFGGPHRPPTFKQGRWICPQFNKQVTGVAEIKIRIVVNGFNKPTTMADALEAGEPPKCVSDSFKPLCVDVKPTDYFEGLIVKRGTDWKYSHEQDGCPASTPNEEQCDGGEGVVYAKDATGCPGGKHIWVNWTDTGVKQKYRAGCKGFYDLCSEQISSYTKESEATTTTTTEAVSTTFTEAATTTTEADEDDTGDETCNTESLRRKVNSCAKAKTKVQQAIKSYTKATKALREEYLKPMPLGCVSTAMKTAKMTLQKATLEMETAQDSAVKHCKLLMDALPSNSNDECSYAGLSLSS